MQQGNTQQPKTIFEQIVLGQQAINDNIVALAENLDVVRRMLEIVINATTILPEPDTSGAEEGKSNKR